MYKGYHKIFWGLIIMTFRIDLGRVNILPATVGIIMILYGIKDLYEDSEIESFRKAGVYAFIDVILTGIGDVLVFLGIEPWYMYILGVVFIVFNLVIVMLTFYKIFEGSIYYLEKNNQFDLGEEYEGVLRFYLVGYMLNILILGIGLMFDISITLVIPAIFLFVLQIYLMRMIKRLRDLIPKLKEKVSSFDTYV